MSLDDHARANGELPSRAADASPDGVYRQRELAGRLRSALTRLPFEQRSAIVLREIDGLSYEEIAYSLNVAVGTVKSRLARAERPSLRTRGNESRMADLRCRVARPQLELLHDAELSVGAQIAVEAHLAHCERCRERVRGLVEMRRVMREWSPRRAAPRNLFDGLPSAVVSRYQAEEAQTLGSRVSRMFEDMHLVWAGLAGTVAMLCCVAVIFGLSPLSTPSRADSLFGMRAMSVSGERSSLTRLDRAVRLPRVRTEAALPLVLGVSYGGS